MILLSVLTIPEIFARQLVEDPRLGRFTWCITKVSSRRLQKFKSTLSIIHILSPFVIHSLSSATLIATLARTKIAVRKGKADQSFADVLREQISHHKQLLISPMILLILALPRLIISLGSLCVDTSWRHYAFLAGYFISFAPIMLTLFVFIVPAPVYRDELKKYFSHVRFCSIPSMLQRLSRKK